MTVLAVGAAVAAAILGVAALLGVGPPRGREMLAIALLAAIPVMAGSAGRAMISPAQTPGEEVTRQLARRLVSMLSGALVVPLGLGIVVLPQRMSAARASTISAPDGGPDAPTTAFPAPEWRPEPFDSPPVDREARREARAVSRPSLVKRPVDWALVEGGFDWQPEFPWEGVTPIVTSDVDERRGELYGEILDAFDVEGHRRYRFDSAYTYCNIYAWDVTKAMGVEIPHWYDEVTGKKTAAGVGSEMSANRMDVWFDEHGAENGWRLVDVQESVAAAQAGQPAVAIWRNPNPRRSGHIALIRPESTPGQVLIAQAGAQNMTSGRYEDVFSNITPRFFTHD